MGYLTKLLFLYIFLSLPNLSCTKQGDDQPVTLIPGAEVLLPGGEYEMGDHFGFVDPSHPTDELPLHKVKVNSFYI